eukprot:CAMPEP_0170600654 /NCGR_PEP_ID=MMETSP0224-20130122/17446_1 /TAXON_ID=285029 /ORGANISM="Togula jolla, Strain CCCM 725" /LENGTH=97 /DNA_ID=CAMNT_0010925387 /DNA_START=708 /DNA_END=1002 /DNA_ORIENTATION=+
MTWGWNDGHRDDALSADKIPLMWICLHQLNYIAVLPRVVHHLEMLHHAVRVQERVQQIRARILEPEDLQQTSLSRRIFASVASRIGLMGMVLRGRHS